MKVYLVISDKKPVTMFSSLQAAEQMCALRPDLHVREAELDDLGPDIKADLDLLHRQVAGAAENPDLPATALMRLEEGQCQQERCPGMMAYGLLHLK